MRRLRKGDKVVLIAGSEKGKEGKIIHVFSDKQQVVIEKLNMRKKHTKASQSGDGGIVEFPSRVSWSNVMLVGASGKPTRVGFKSVKGKKVRVSLDNNEVIDR